MVKYKGFFEHLEKMVIAGKNKDLLIGSIEKIEHEDKLYEFDKPLSFIARQYKDGLKEFELPEISMNGVGKTFKEAWSDLEKTFSLAHELISNADNKISKRCGKLVDFVNNHCKFTKRNWLSGDSLGDFLKELAFKHNALAEYTTGKINGKIASKLIEYRVDNNLSRKDLANKLDIICAEYLEGMEHGDVQITIDTLVKIADKLDGEFDIIFNLPK